MKKTITINLSENSVDQAIKEFQGLKKDVGRMASFMETGLLRQFKANATKNVRRTVGHTGYEPTGELESSFQTHRVTRYVGAVINVDPNSAAVEFGTGIVGAQASHPFAGKLGYTYDQKGHGKNGWDYFVDGEKFHTKGQVAHRFMYDAIIELEASREVQEIGIEAFNKAFGGG